MKKILYILVFLFSCELEQQFGVQEFEDSFSYYDFIAYGWGEVFNGDKTLALDYFNQALNSSDITYYNSAIVGMGWAVTYQANNLLNTPECIDNIEDCTDIVDQYRNNAKCYFYKSSLSEDLSLQNSAQILDWCNQDDVDIDDLYSSVDFMILELEDMVNYYTGCVDDEGNPYVSCFENFVIDLKVGYIYLEYLSYIQSITDDLLEDEPISNVILLFQQFYDEYCSFDISEQNYNIMHDKSNYTTDYTLTYKNIASVLSSLYLNDGNYDLSCQYAKDICSDLDCEEPDILNLIDCLDSF